MIAAMATLLLAQDTGATTPPMGMQPLGWAFMTLSIGAVLIVTAYCYWKVLTAPSPEQTMHAPLDIDTRDRDT